jgi:sarcosine oxidase
METYDVIALGTGGVGAAALYHLANRGVRALGLDRFPPGHDRGSSHGESRIIRRSYFEHPDYVPLLESAYTLWDELAAIRGEALFHRTGQIYFGPPDGVVIPGALASAKKHGLDVQQISLREAEKEYPGYSAPEGATAVFERDAGYLLVEDCVRAHLEEAVKLGARHRHGETVQSWSATNSGVVVETDQGQYSAGRLIVAAGCWSSDLLSELGVRLPILRKHMHWYASDSNDYLESTGCPCFFCEVNGGYFYGFPKRGELGIKVAEHSGGREITDPLSDPRELDPSDVDRIETFLAQCLPGVSLRRTRHEVCFYTMSPDEHFIVDRHPEHDSVVFAAGLSGHGFKFTAALGKALAELALDGVASVDLDFLRLGRPGIAS